MKTLSIPIVLLSIILLGTTCAPPPSTSDSAPAQQAAQDTAATAPPSTSDSAPAQEAAQDTAATAPPSAIITVDAKKVTGTVYNIHDLYKSGSLPQDASIPPFENLYETNGDQILYGQGNYSYPAVIGDGYRNIGVYGYGGGAGVAGRGVSGPGVWGEGSPGVYGTSYSEPGVKGYSKEDPGGRFESGSEAGAEFYGAKDKPDVYLGGNEGILSGPDDTPYDKNLNLILRSGGNVLVKIDSDCGSNTAGTCGDNSQFSVQDSGSNHLLSVDKSGNTTTKVLSAEQVTTDKARTGILEITGGADLSEMFIIHKPTPSSLPTAGMVVSIDPDHPGDLVLSTEAYDHRVAGVIAGAGGIQPGIVMAQNSLKPANTFPVAVTGRVYCWADASNGPIEPGDLLTTSDIPGYAMKAADYQSAQGATIGKAMTSLSKETGLVLILVTLR